MKPPRAKVVRAVVHRFPEAVAGPVADISIDGFLAALAASIGDSFGMAATLAPGGGAPAGAWLHLVSADRGQLALALPDSLAAALASVRCGGWPTDAGTGDPQSASMIAAQQRLLGAARQAAAQAWPGDWQLASPPAAPPPGAPHRLALVIGEGAFDIAVARLAGTAPSAAGPAPWQAGWAAALRATPLPVRAVLYEARLPLRQAAALVPGDVLPIETPRDVRLRTGALGLARGSIGTGDGGTQLVTITSGPGMAVSPRGAETAP